MNGKWLIGIVIALGAVFAVPTGVMTTVLNDRMAGIDQRMASLEVRLDARIDRVEDKIDRLDAKFDAKFDQLNAKLDKVLLALTSRGIILPAKPPK